MTKSSGAERPTSALIGPPTRSSLPDHSGSSDPDPCRTVATEADYVAGRAAAVPVTARGTWAVCEDAMTITGNEDVIRC